MNVNIKFIKNNKKIILLMIMFVIIFSIINIFVTLKCDDLEEKDLPINGEVKYTGLMITEIMSKNSGSVSSPDGIVSDWIEIYNSNKHEVNLKNYGLSDQSKKVKWVFPDVVIKPESYLVVYLTGKKSSGVYASFKLNRSGNESLFLVNPKGKVVDAVKTYELEKDQVMVRDLDGNWYKSTTPTPGYANTKDGYLEYSKDLYAEGSIKINEVLPNNAGNFKNSYDNYVGYIEIINEGKETLDLTNYCVSNSLLVPFKYCMQDVTLSPSEVKVIYMGKYKSTDTETYAGFNLNSKTGVAVLTNSNGKIIDKVEYKNLANGLSLVKENNDFFETSNVSPGYANDTNGIKKFSKEKLKTKKGLIINEVMNNNTSYVVNNGNRYYDWIELKNNSNSDINLSDYSITNSLNDLNKCELEDITIKPNEYYIIMASGDSNLSNNSYKHCNFKISNVESIYLIKNKNIEDSMLISNVPVNQSIGRGSDYGIYYFKTPTPKSKNTDGTLAISYTPKLSQNSGVYNNVDGINLEISGNGTVFYTLDGSIPNTNSKVYTGPIFLSKTTVVKAISYDQNRITGSPAVGTYIINENHNIPVMSVSLNGSDFNYMHSNPWNTDIEVSAYAELYEDGKSFKIPCGLKLFGGSTRGLTKKSFALKFRKKYGEANLKYQVFDNRDYSVFDTLILRSGSQDIEFATIRDILMTSLVDGITNLSVQAYKSVILYINGNYWGIYNIREKVDDDYIANNFNVSKEDANIVRIDNNVTTGTIDKYSNLLKFLRTHDITKKENYEYVKGELNVESYADFWAAQNWVTNNDIVNTRFYWHKDVDSGRINMIFYDLDYAMWNYDIDYMTFMTSKDGMSRLNVSTEMMRYLIQNDEFKKTFLNRLSYQVKKVWNSERVNKKIDEILEKLDPEMKRNQERWNYTYEDFKKNVDYLREYEEKRLGYLKKSIKNYFKLSDKEMKEYFGD